MSVHRYAVVGGGRGVGWSGVTYRAAHDDGLGCRHTLQGEHWLTGTLGTGEEEGEDEIREENVERKGVRERAN